MPAVKSELSTIVRDTSKLMNPLEVLIVKVPSLATGRQPSIFFIMLKPLLVLE